MNRSALFLLMVVVFSGCVIQRPSEGGGDLEYQKLFEDARRSESMGDSQIAGDTYEWLIGRGSRYGEYGLAKLLLRKETSSRVAKRYLISCAKRSSHTSKFFPDTEMDSAFSVAAMAELANIAELELERPDIADALRNMMARVATPQVRYWAKRMASASDSDFANIYKDIIGAVESCRASSNYIKDVKWTEITEVFLGGENHPIAVSHEGSTPTPMPPKTPQYSVVKFVKTPDTKCQYDFEVRLEGNGTFETTEKVRTAIRRQLVNEFLLANPNSCIDDIRTAFLSWNQSEMTITGSVVVMKVTAVRIEYDAVTRRGKIAVRLDGRDIDAARKWAIGNIEELATGKNIPLVVGQPPQPGASFKIGNERMTEEGLLEIEFHTLN